MVKESSLQFYIVREVENLFTPKERQKLSEAIHYGKQLNAAKLPEGFKTLKRLLFGPAKAKGNTAGFQLEIRELDGKISKLERNLGFVDPKRIPKLQTQLDGLEERRKELRAAVKNAPTEAHIDFVVEELLEKLFTLDLTNWGPPSVNQRKGIGDLKGVIREIDRINVDTKISGEGAGLRHKLTGGTIQWKAGVVMPRSLNPYFLLHRQACIPNTPQTP